MMDLKNLVLLALGLLVVYTIYKNKWNFQVAQSKFNNVILTVFDMNKKKSQIIADNGSSDTTLDFIAGAPIDLNNTGEDAIFIGGGHNHDDMLLVYRGGRMVDIIDQTNLNDPQATYSAVSADLDHNGYTDLVVARENGVWLYQNYGQGRFEKRLILPANGRRLPLSLAITDYNKDGHADIYVSQYIHPSILQNSSKQITRNTLLEGLGSGAFEDVTQRTGTGGTRNTFNSTWVDLDNDKLPDLVLTQDSGEIEIYKNTRGASGAKFTSGNKFYRMKVPTGYGFRMMVTPRDIDNDGDMDLVLSNKNGSKHVILRNDGNFKFTEQEIKQDLEFGWGAVMDHINLGNRSNISTVNTNNDEGIKWFNIAGPHKIYTNPLKNQNWISVRLPNSAPYFNATVKVVSIDDKNGKIRKQSKQATKGSGLGNDPSSIMTFGLGQDTRVLNLEVHTIYDGNRWIHPAPKINKIAVFRDMKSNYYTHKSRDENGQLPLNKSDLLGMHQF